jgi:intracellular multiplication protein IcmL
MTTAQQPAAHRNVNTARSAALNEDPGAMIPIARLEALMAMGRAFPPVVTALSLSLLMSLGASGWLLYRQTHSVPVYFTTDANGRAIEVKPLTEPSMTREQVSQYVVDSLSECMSMDYVNYKDSQDRCSKRYTQEAFNALVKSFQDQGIYETMTKRKLVLRAIATGAPRIVAEGEPNPGQPYSWVVQLPVAWTFASAQRDTTVSYVIQAVVTRCSTVERANGIAISTITVSRGGADT